MPQDAPEYPDEQGSLSLAPEAGARRHPPVSQAEQQEPSPLVDSSAPESSDAEALQNLLLEWISTPDWLTSEAFLQDHPLLLREESEHVLALLSQHQTDKRIRAMLVAHLQLLHTARRQGVEAAYAPLQNPEVQAATQADGQESLVSELVAWLQAPGLAASQAYLQAHPRLLTEQAEQELDQLKHLQPEGEKRELLDTQQALLHDARIWGVSGAYTYYQLAAQLPTLEVHEGVQLLQEVQEWLNTPTWEQSQAYLEAHPHLRTRDAEALLAMLWQGEQTDAMRVPLAQHLQILQRARVEGTAAAYRELPHPDTLNEMGMEAFRRYLTSGIEANLHEALVCWQQALMLISPEDPARPFLLNNLGSGLSDRYGRTGALADLEAAIRSFQQALDTALPDSPSCPALLNNLGSALTYRYARTGALADLEAAISAYQEALDITPSDSPDRPTRLSNLGSGLRYRYGRTGALADLEAAISAYQEALDTTPSDSSDRPDRLNNLGNGLSDRYGRTGALADLEAAISAYQEALDTALPDSPSCPALLNNLGSALTYRYARTGALADLEAAISACQRALDITPPDSSDRPDRLNNLGNGFRYRYGRTGALADLEAAISAYQEALDISPPDSLYRPGWLSNLGLTLHDRYGRTGALADLEAAISAYQEALDISPPYRPARLRTLGEGLYDRYARTGALADLEAALAAWEASWAARYSRFISLPVVYQLGQQRQGRDLAALLVTGYLELAARSRPSRQTALRHAFEVVEGSKSRLLTQLVGRGPLPLPSGLSLQAADREYQLLSDLSVLDMRDIASHDRPVANQHRLSDPDRLQQRYLLVQELDQLWASIAHLNTEGADYVALRRGDPPTWKSLAHLVGELGPATALLSLFTTADQILLWLLRSTWRLPRVVEAPLDQEGRKNLFDRFFREVHHYIPGLRRGETWDQPLRPLLAQAQRHLVGVERLILAPVGTEHVLPWGVLAQHAGWRTAAGEPIPLVTLPALGVLPRLRQRPRVHAGRALVVGNPLGDLPHAEVEAKAVAERFGTPPLLGSAATKKAFLARLAGASLIHLATHAFFAPKNPLDSGIVLADGVLTAREVLQYRLQADLLVLSACESGQVGSLGGEELAGLSQAFLQAGVRSLLVSLWQVNDPATAALMQAFYAARQAGADKALALRQAMTHIQQDPHWTHPYYWGAFVLLGDWDSAWAV
jgi:tetratricopeptide (TPR) repeat protein